MDEREARVWQQVDAPTAAMLRRFGFDADRFETLRARLRRGEAGPEANRVRGELRPPEEGDVRLLPPAGSAEAEALRREALEAVARGQLAAVVLAGGMATRFGGVVKALVEALPGRSFLALKLADAAALAREAGAPVPLRLMSSFATDEALREGLGALRAEAPGVEADVFPQFVSLRLTEEGGLLRDEAGRPSPYATGHGDLPFALRAGAALPEAVRYVFVSNVDNLGASLDPVVLGAHLRALREGASASVEVAPKHPGDQGGAPARLDGVLQIVEGFRFPPGFDQDRIPVFNTNTFLLRREALEALPESALDWFAVRKEVGGRPAIQFERLLGQVTATLPTALLRVPREGAESRFLPVKRPEDLERLRSAIEAVVAHRVAG